jgi:hypothetical protein
MRARRPQSRGRNNRNARDSRIVETKVGGTRAFGAHDRGFSQRAARQRLAFLLLNALHNAMKVFVALLSLMLVFSAAAAKGTVALIDSVPAQAPAWASHTLSEPAGLVVVGLGFVLLASRVRSRNV